MANVENAEAAIEFVYERNEGNEDAEDFFRRHGINSMSILTIHSYFAAVKECEALRERITGKTVIEIGAGVGLLAMEMANYAKRVYAIECDAAWSWVFTQFLYATKRPNLTWIFGAAETVSDVLRGDIAIVYTRSDSRGMKELALKMCPEVVMGPLFSIEEHCTPEELGVLEKAKGNLGDFSKELVSRHGVSAEFVNRVLNAK